MSTISTTLTPNSQTTILKTEQEASQASAATKSGGATTDNSTVQDKVSLSAEAKEAKRAKVAEAVAEIHALGAAWEERLESSLKAAYVEPSEKEEQEKTKAEKKTDNDAGLEASEYDQKIAEDLLEGESSDSTGTETGTGTSSDTSTALSGQSSAQVIKLNSAYARLSANKGSTLNASA